MHFNRQSKWKVLLIALIFGGALMLGQAEKAHAHGEGAVVIGAIAVIGAILATYATVMTTVCIPVAAIKASDHPGGLGGAFGDCFFLRARQTPPAPTKQDESVNSSEIPPMQLEQPSYPSSDPGLEEIETEAPVSLSARAAFITSSGITSQSLC